MQDLFNEKNKRISELEVALATTKSLLDYSKEINLKNKNGREVNEVVEKVKETSPVKPKKCKFENTGTCNRKESCKFLHPASICQGFSRFGSCPKEGKCEDRHPRSICHAWRNARHCPEGNACRDRHPQVISSPPTTCVETKPQISTPAPSYYFPAPPTTNYPPCRASNQMGYQGHQPFLDVGVAAVCGPGLNMVRPSLTACCQDQVQHSHDQPRQVTHPLHHPSRLQSWPQLQRSQGL